MKQALRKCFLPKFKYFLDLWILSLSVEKVHGLMRKAQALRRGDDFPRQQPRPSAAGLGPGSWESVDLRMLSPCTGDLI